MTTNRAYSTRPQTKRIGVVTRYLCVSQARRPHGSDKWASAQNIGGGFEGVMAGSLISGKLDREATAGP